MTKTTTVRRFFLAAAAFGLASFGLAGAASADPDVTASVSLRAGVKVKAGAEVSVHRIPVRGRGGYEPDYGYPVRDHRKVEPYWTALRRYDRNRNRIIDPVERKSFWMYMAGTGVYGRLSQDEVARFAQLAGRFDANSDGRLVGMEWRGMDKLIDSLRMFQRLDYNRDKYLSAWEVGFSIFAPRFRVIDMNRDRVISQQEVRDDVLRTYRA
jgi:hypothetical protein